MYLLDFTELRISGLVLQWLHKKTTAKSSKTSANDQYNPVPIRMPLDHRALSVRLAHPKEGQSYPKYASMPCLICRFSSQTR